VSRTVYGTKKDAELAAAELTMKPARNAGGRKLRQLLDEWIDIKTPGWADLTIRDQTSRARQVGLGSVAGSHADDGDAQEGVVGVAVAASVEPVGVVAGGDEERAGGADAVSRDELRCSVGNEGVEVGAGRGVGCRLGCGL
jgi:hypothetical protein